FLPAEDAVAVQAPGGKRQASVKIAVPVLAHISNHDDFDPLMAEPAVELDFVYAGRPLPADADLIVLPGSKATLADLAFLRAQGWDIDIRAHVRQGKPVLGICGGYQMLGRSVADPGGVEGVPDRTAGLGLLDVETVLTGDKTLTAASGIERASGVAVAGYEMHIGRTEGADRARPFLVLAGEGEGARSAD
ncbi:MAG: cobyric acid synthase CobQ, partial [Rhodobacteraceae bacterium]|nr:cobyric acid synthase CobQ [Paracoccaceae bacterium]